MGQAKTNSDASSCPVNSIIMICTCALAGCFFRTSIREQNNIQGSCIGDCIAYVCCTPCAISQTLYETKQAGPPQVGYMR